jgi:hypothetical protein
MPEASTRRMSGRSRAEAYICKTPGAEHPSEVSDLCQQVPW